MEKPIAHRPLSGLWLALVHSLVIGRDATGYGCAFDLWKYLHELWTGMKPNPLLFVGVPLFFRCFHVCFLKLLYWFFTYKNCDGKFKCILSLFESHIRVLNFLSIIIIIFIRYSNFCDWKINEIHMMLSNCVSKFR